MVVLTTRGKVVSSCFHPIWMGKSGWLGVLLVTDDEVTWLARLGRSKKLKIYWRDKAMVQVWTGHNLWMRQRGMFSSAWHVVKSALGFCDFGAWGDHSDVTNIGMGERGVNKDMSRASTPRHITISFITKNFIVGNRGVLKHFCAFVKSF